MLKNFKDFLETQYPGRPNDLETLKNIAVLLEQVLRHGLRARIKEHPGEISEPAITDVSSSRRVAVLD